MLLFLIIFSLEFQEFCTSNIKYDRNETIDVDLLTKVYGNFAGHIVNGVDVPSKMYPHIALLKYMGIPTCGGSIITDRAILTAAHCLVSPFTLLPVEDYNHVSVEVGTTIAGKESLAVYPVCALKQHPKYGKADHMFDIGLVHLSERIQFSDNVKPIKISNTSQWRNERSRLNIAGFGKTKTSDMSQRLQSTVMKFVPTSKCKGIQNTLVKSYFMNVPRHMFCLIGQHYNSDCSGDSGSPVMWGKYLVGLVTTGIVLQCGSPTVPSMYTDAVYFRNWIDINVKKMEAKYTVEQCPKDIIEMPNLREIADQIYRQNPILT